MSTKSILVHKIVEKYVPRIVHFWFKLFGNSACVFVNRSCEKHTFPKTHPHFQISKLAIVWIFTLQILFTIHQCNVLRLFDTITYSSTRVLKVWDYSDIVISIIVCNIILFVNILHRNGRKMVLNEIVGIDCALSSQFPQSFHGCIKFWSLFGICIFAWNYVLLYAPYYTLDAKMFLLGWYVKGIFIMNYTFQYAYVMRSLGLRFGAINAILMEELRLSSHKIPVLNSDLATLNLRASNVVRLRQCYAELWKIALTIEKFDSLKITLCVSVIFIALLSSSYYGVVHVLKTGSLDKIFFDLCWIFGSLMPLMALTENVSDTLGEVSS